MIFIKSYKLKSKYWKYNTKILSIDVMQNKSLYLYFRSMLQTITKSSVINGGFKLLNFNPQKHKLKKQVKPILSKKGLEFRKSSGNQKIDTKISRRIYKQ